MIDSGLAGKVGLITGASVFINYLRLSPFRNTDCR